MSDFLKKIKGIFIEEEANKTAQNVKPDSIEKSTMATTPANNTNYALSPESSAFRAAMPIETNLTEMPNEKFFDILFKALEQSNLPGYDYFEFKQTLKQLVNLNMDEATRYKSAYAMAQTLGATNTKLINTALQYLDVLQNEKNKFNASAENQRKAQIDSRRQQATDFEKSIQEKQNMIDALTKEIANLQQQKSTLSGELEQTEKRWTQTKADFERAFGMVTAEIQTDITKIKNYIA